MTLPQDPVAWAVKAFKDGRNDKYSAYAAYIDGDQPLVFATEKFKSAFGRQFAAFAYNRCEMVVDAHADRLQIEGFGADNEAASQRAMEVWDDNHMDIRAGHANSDALGLGDSYLFVEVHPERGDVQFWVQDPRTVRVHYSDETPGKVDLAAKAWKLDDERVRLNLFFPDHVEKYITRNRAPSGMPQSASAFERYTTEGQEWTYRLNIDDTVPMFPIANNGRTGGYGFSELQNVIPLQDALNKSVMDMLVAMEFAAFPQRVLIGVDLDDEGMDDLKRFQAGINRMFTLQDPNSKVAEFSATNIAQYLSVMEFFDVAVSRVSRVPVHYLSMTGGFPSGRALRLAETPFVAKVEDRQKAFGQAYSEAMTYALRLSGMAIEPGDLRVNWKSAAPLSQEDMLDRAEMQQRLGFPFQQILMEMGYEPEQIAEMLANRQRERAEFETLFIEDAASGARQFDVQDEEEAA